MLALDVAEVLCYIVKSRYSSKFVARYSDGRRNLVGGIIVNLEYGNCICQLQFAR